MNDKRKKIVLIVDDNSRVREGLRLSLFGEPYEVLESDHPDLAYKTICDQCVDAVLLDIHFGGPVTGLTLLEKINREQITVPVIVLSGVANVSEVAQAMKFGAKDFLEKPISSERLRTTLKNVLEMSHLKRTNVRQFKSHHISSELIGKSAAIESVREQIQIFAPRDIKVLITGETGTGKEIVANLVQQNSLRFAESFVVVNCAAIPENLIESELFGHKKGSFTGAVSDQVGKIELAHGGTMFLDEIGELSQGAQSKLLRFLETGEIQVLGSNRSKICDVRVIAATSRSLIEEVKSGRFRGDLFYRLNVACIDMPPLRQRQDDILPLFRYFVTSFCRRHNESDRVITDDCYSFLVSYDWPGNIRELRNFAERCSILSHSVINHKSISSILNSAKRSNISTIDSIVSGFDSLDETISLKEFRSRCESAYISYVLKKNSGSISKSAQDLQLDRSHLHVKIRDLRIDAKDIGNT